MTRKLLDSMINEVQVDLDDAVSRKAYSECAPLQQKLDELFEKRKSFPTIDELQEAVKKAEEAVKLLQKLAQAGDGPVSKQDAVGYATILKKSDDVLETFFELLRDVPDEL